MSGRVHVLRDGAVWTATLDNPGRRNALTWEMYDTLSELCSDVRDDPDVRVLVLRGEGDEAFAAGTDIHQFRGFTAQDGITYEKRVGRVLSALLDVRIPVVAVVQGHAVGAGLALVACADVVVATDDATFGAPVARTLGNCLPPPVVARVQRRLGVARTMAMLLTARLLPAQEAAYAGLVSDVVPAEELEERVDDVVRRIARGAPLTLAGLKEVDRRLERSSPVVDADDVLATCYGSADFAEGVAAFVERRRPVWTGR